MIYTSLILLFGWTIAGYMSVPVPEKYGCPEGEYLLGKTCLSCRHHCLSCDREHFCDKCNETWYGPTCDTSCDTCQNGTCNTTGCVHGCRDGYISVNYTFYNASFGQYCESCDSFWTHCSVCNPEKCLRCSFHKWGPNCKKECFQTCEEDGSCSILTGKCDRKCPDGQYRNTKGKCAECPSGCTACTTENNCSSCVTGTYGPHCNMLCNSMIPGCGACAVLGTRVTCSYCQYNYFILQGACTPCSEHCSAHDNVSTCSALTGICLFGCKPRRWGNYCENACSPSCLDSQCNSTTGYCTACDIYHHGDNCIKSDRRYSEGETSGHNLPSYLSNEISQILLIFVAILLPSVCTMFVLRCLSCIKLRNTRQYHSVQLYKQA